MRGRSPALRSGLAEAASLLSHTRLGSTGRAQPRPEERGGAGPGEAWELRQGRGARSGGGNCLRGNYVLYRQQGGVFLEQGRELPLRGFALFVGGHAL